MKLRAYELSLSIQNLSLARYKYLKTKINHSKKYKYLHPVIASKTFACFLCVSQRYFMLIGILYNFVFFGYRHFHGILEFKIKHVLMLKLIYLYFLWISCIFSCHVAPSKNGQFSDQSSAQFQSVVGSCCCRGCCWPGQKS